MLQSTKPFAKPALIGTMLTIWSLRLVSTISLWYISEYLKRASQQPRVRGLSVSPCTALKELALGRLLDLDVLLCIFFAVVIS